MEDAIALQGGGAAEAGAAAIQREALELLEWPRLCGQVASFAVTPAGRRQVEALLPGVVARCRGH